MLKQSKPIKEKREELVFGVSISKIFDDSKQILRTINLIKLNNWTFLVK